MWAAVLEGQEKLVVKEVETPLCGEGEVLVRVKACGICRTDMKCYTLGQRDLKLPRILGHEIAGVVEDVGLGVTEVRKGDRVQVSPGIPCGSCAYCRLGRDNLCETLGILGFNEDGGFAEIVRVPRNAVAAGVLNPLPAGITYAQATLAEPLGCCINMQEAMAMNPGSTLLIMGAGRLGWLTARLAKHRGLAKVIVMEKDPQRMAIATQGDFDALVDGHCEHAVAQVLKLTDGRGVDGVIPCCPGHEALALGIACLKKGGVVGFFSGLVGEGLSASVLNQIHYKEMVMVGAYGHAIRHGQQALRLIADGSVCVEELLRVSIGLEDVEQGLVRVNEQKDLSVWINYE